ncbi:MAG: glycosyltransferase family 4 protein [Lachnospiraceae bacterium]|nr:glycosyltransferase family 4 protein [Lachnospiraceae bacterium]
MDVLLTGSVHLYKDSDGIFYSTTVYDYEFLERYLKVFDGVKLVGKVRMLDQKQDLSLKVVSGPGVTIIEFPWYRGIKGMISKAPSLIRCMLKARSQCDCYIFRIAQIESFLMFLFRKRKYPYAVEVVNNPKTLEELSKVQKLINVFLVKRMIKKASGVSYVTKKSLQADYPARHSAQFVESYSSVDIKNSDIVLPDDNYEIHTPLKIVHVSNAIESDGKGHTTLIDALKKVKEKGYQAEVFFVGAGTKVSEFESYAKNRGIGDSVHFIGRISGHKDMLDFLKACDLMVFPSKSEGLPRTIIEAMAVGLPCISTNVGGIPELLERRYLFSPLDVEGFATEVCRLIDNPKELEEMSRENIKRAKDYSSDVLTERRTTFYKKLKRCVEEGRKCMQ